MRKAVSIFPFCLSLVLHMLAAGQTTQTPLSKLPPSARQLIAIKAVGSKRYSEETIAAASGLQLGTPVSDDDFKKAARRLGDTGVFTDIGYSFTYSSAGTKLEFHVTDFDKFVPVRFEDFVWFSDEELMKRMKEHIPLFDGELPLSGRMADEVSDVLQAMLVERAVPGTVEYERAGKSDGPVDAIVYRVSNVVIEIRNVEFNGAAESELPVLKEASRRVFEREYSRTVLNALVEHQLLPVYHARGYLKARFSAPQPKVIKQPSADNDQGVRNLTVVDVIYDVLRARSTSSKAWNGRAIMNSPRRL